MTIKKERNDATPGCKTFAHRSGEQTTQRGSLRGQVPDLALAVAVVPAGSPTVHTAAHIHAPPHRTGRVSTDGAPDGREDPPSLLLYIKRASTAFVRCASILLFFPSTLLLFILPSFPSAPFFPLPYLPSLLHPSSLSLFYLLTLVSPTMSDSILTQILTTLSSLQSSQLALAQKV